MLPRHLTINSVDVENDRIIIKVSVEHNLLPEPVNLQINLPYNPAFENDINLLKQTIIEEVRSYIKELRKELRKNRRKLSQIEGVQLEY